MIAHGATGVGVFLVFGGSGGDGEGGEKVGCGASGATSGTGGGAGVEKRTVVCVGEGGALR